MVTILVDGEEYFPKGRATPGGHHPRIGIAITTHNRKKTLARALTQHQKFLPPGALLVVVDDGSSPPAEVPPGVRLIRNEKPEGIVAAKNACLRVLLEEDEGEVNHFFLFDDDAWPIADNWWVPYVDSPEPHLAYQFLDLAGPRKLRDITVTYQDLQHIAYSGQRGVMLYYHRSAIEKAGGFDWGYGRGMYEHPDLALRIHNLGLTSWPFADVQGSKDLIHSCDEHEEVERSLTLPDRQSLVQRNVALYNSRRDAFYSGYSSPYPGNPTVVTCLLTTSPDPQRKVKMLGGDKLLEAWGKSIAEKAPGTKTFVLADELEPGVHPLLGFEVVHVPPVQDNPYFLRWLRVYQFLRVRPENNLVWVTDGTDVEMLRSPWANMDRSKLYVGSEPKTLRDDWMLTNHKASHLQAFLRENPHLPMLNAGLVGGTRENVMAFAHHMIRDWHMIKCRRFWGKEAKGGSEVGDMASFNYVAYTYWSDRIVTGPQVHSVFRSDERSPYAWWKHK